MKHNFLAIGLFLCFTSPATTGELSTASMNKAFKCSLTHAVEYAEFTNENASAIADMAHKKCASDWYIFEVAVRAETMSELQDQLKDASPEELHSLAAPSTNDNKLAKLRIEQTVMEWRVSAGKNGPSTYTHARESINER